MNITRNKSTFSPLGDIYYDDFCPETPKAIILFLHGFKGFKDWGTWDLLANYFCQQEIQFIKLNFSHNGVFPGNGIELNNEAKFSENTYSKELADCLHLLTVIDNQNRANKLPIFLLGHSRGGGIALLAANEARVTGVITLGSLCKLNRWSKETLKQWEETGVRYISNVRTGKQLPMKYDIVTDYFEKEESLDIKKNTKNSLVPTLIIHGAQDETVHIKEAIKLKNWIGEKATLSILENCNHVLGGFHPFNEIALPLKLKEAAQKAASFIKTLL